MMKISLSFQQSLHITVLLSVSFCFHPAVLFSPVQSCLYDEDQPVLPAVSPYCLPFCQFLFSSCSSVQSNPLCMMKISLSSQQSLHTVLLSVSFCFHSAVVFSPIQSCLYDEDQPAIPAVSPYRSPFCQFLFSSSSSVHCNLLYAHWHIGQQQEN